MPRKKTSDIDPEAGSGFEESLAEIERIVEAMEHEQLPLEELVARFERGSHLLDRCEHILRSARERIELITLRNTPDDPPAGGSGAPTDLSDEPDADADDDIRLF